MTNPGLILGTVQLGMKYGVANVNGQPDFQSALEIAKTAWQGGVREFDTAAGYGESETTLGRIFKELGIECDVEVNSKPATNWDGQDFDALERDIDTSLENLNVSSLHTLILHRERLLENWEHTRAGLNRFIQDGRVRQVGISVYTPEAGANALSLEGLDVVQIPSNFLDRRFERADLQNLSKDKGKSLQIRSIFLQGLIFMSPNDLPNAMSFARETINDVQDFLADMELTPLEAAIGYVRQAWPDSALLFGAETPNQVKENLEAFARPVPSSFFKEAQKRFPDLPEKLLNPSMWGEQ